MLGTLAVFGVASAVTGLLYLWFVRPDLIVAFGQNQLMKRSGCIIKSVTVGRTTYCYAERGSPNSKPTLVLVHGFSDRKDTWLQLLRKLSKDMHIVMVDVLGHGDTTVPPPGTDLTFPSLVESLKEQLHAIGLDRKPFHLVGTSMGGVIAGMYTGRYKNDVAKVTLICPAVVTPVETEFMSIARAGRCKLIPDNVDQLKEMFDNLMYKKLKLPKQILQGILTLRTPRNEFYTRLFNALMEPLHDEAKLKALEDEWHDATVPLHVVWGKHDQIIHPSGAERLQKEVPTCKRVDLIDNCGHMVAMEKPGLLAKYLMEFREE